jgi:hypothetical protein
MSHAKEITAGDPCPTCGGAFVVDASQAPEALVEHHKRVAASPAAAVRYADAVAEKTAAAGVVHVCATCGYRARFTPARTGTGGKRAA